MLGPSQPAATSTPTLTARFRARERTLEPANTRHGEEPDEDYADEFDEELEESRNPWRTAIGWGVTVALAILLSLLIRSFVVHAFHVESGSMQPTLSPGDRILVNKLTDNPSRGDIIVFKRPDGDLVKRVVAFEGETVYFDEGLVKIGEDWLVEPYLVAGTGTYVRSAIPNCDPTEGFATDQACTVPEDHIFVLGDNRNVSFDSRNFGPVPRGDLIGNAALQFWPVSDLRRL